MNDSTSTHGGAPRSLPIRLAPAFVFLALLGLTLLVWGQLVEHQRDLLARHTEDVCLQAARRLQIRLESRLSVASIFAHRWSLHESRDFTRRRFEEFASVLLEELPAYHTIRMLRPNPADEWVVPGEAGSHWSYVVPKREKLLAATREGGKLTLLPHQCNETQSCLFAVLPLKRGNEFLGHLVVEFRSQKLIGDVFHDRVRSEFNIEVRDGDTLLFRFAEDARQVSTDHIVGYEQSFAVRDRTWRVTMVPREAQLASTGWFANPSLPLLGIVLSISVSLLIRLLSRRMELYRIARDRALDEMAKREAAQEELKTSEARYRSVFHSATDGLVVIDENDRIVEANPAAAAMHGYSPAAFLGLPYPDLVEPNHKHCYQELKRQLDRSGFARLDSVHVTSDGKSFDVEVRGTSFHFGAEPRVLGILTDVSDRKRASERQAMLSRKVLMAQEEERARVSRDLHDELGQILTALRLELDMLRRKPAESGEKAGAAFGDAVGMVEKAAEELRHICRGLRPPLLDDLGVEPAIKLLAEEFEQHSDIRVDMKVELNEDDGPIPREIALGVYRILQESLNNVGRHARAENVVVSVTRSDTELQLTIGDDGLGFDVDNAKKIAGGFGIAGMRERASLVNGTIDIRSEPFKGTRVEFRVPLETPAGGNRHDEHTGSR
jgi:two-component system sensor histidine kinase NreB